MPASQFTVCATGHRPAKLGPNPYSPATFDLLHKVAHYYLITHLPDRAISGMALGWDTAFALAALNLSIPLICAIPCPQQPARWPPSAVQLWKHIKDRAIEVHIISPKYTRQCMQRRNIWMVNNSDEVIALWNGAPGGTANCIQFAQQVRKPITNLWPQFQKEMLSCP